MKNEELYRFVKLFDSSLEKQEKEDRRSGSLITASAIQSVRIALLEAYLILQSGHAVDIDPQTENRNASEELV